MKLGIAAAALVAALCAGGPPARAATPGRVFSDADFVTGTYHTSTVEFGSGGTMGLVRKSTGGVAGGYLEVEFRFNASSSSAPAVYGIVIFDGGVWDPATDGAIRSLDYAESAIQLLGTNQGQRTGPALEQNGVVYIAELKSDPIFTPEAVWTRKSRAQLTQGDFAIANTLTHPDFSATGAPIRFGFFRANSGTPNQPAATGPLCGIDDWRVEVNAPPRLLVGDEIRAQTDSVGTPVSGAVTTNPHEEHRAPRQLDDRVDADSPAVALAGTTAGSARSRARASPSGGLGAFSQAAATLPLAVPVGTSFVTTARASFRRKFVMQSSGTADVPIDVVNFAEGTLDLKDTVVNNPATPGVDSAGAKVILEVILHTAAASATVFRAEAEVSHQGGGPLAFVKSGSSAFLGSFAIGAAAGDPYATMNYAEVINDIALVPVNEEIAVEFALSTQARAGLSAAGWLATANFYDTFRLDVQTRAPGVTVQEITTSPLGRTAGTRLLGKRKLAVRGHKAFSGAADWRVLIGDGQWSAEAADGLSMTGTAARKGKSGRVFDLTLDAASVQALVAALVVDAQAGGQPYSTMERGTLLPIVARWTSDKRGKKIKLALKLPVLATEPLGVRAGTLTFSLSGPPAKVKARRSAATR